MRIDLHLQLPTDWIDMQFFKDWKLSRMKRNLQLLNTEAEHWRKEQTRLAFAAYDIPDMMQEPMRWGRLQNAANWAGYHYRQTLSKAEKLQSKIDAFIE